ncbi:MAG: hypothetical protein WC501_00730 [Candidatus Micrarchaeia archaeon]
MCHCEQKGISKQQCKYLGDPFSRQIILIEDYRKERDRAFSRMEHQYRKCNGPGNMECEHLFKMDEMKPNSDQSIMICRKETKLVSRT